MANRDVQLIIRAKDQASKALDKVAGSLKSFNDDQEKLMSSANGADQAIGQLGSQFGKLNAQIEGAKAIEKMAGNLDRAETGLENLRHSVKSTEDNLEQYFEDISKTVDALELLERTQASLDSTLKRQKEDLAATGKGMTTVAAATREVARAEVAYQKALDKQTTGKKVDVQAAKDRLDGAKATKVAADEVAASQAAQRTAIVQTEKAIVSNNAAIREAGKEHKSLEIAIESETAALKAGYENLDQGEQAYADLAFAVRDAAQSFGLVVNEQNKLAGITPKVVVEAQRLLDVMAALGRFNTKGPAGFVDSSTAAQFRKVRNEIDENNAAWKALESEIAATAKEMKAAGQPTQDQVAKFNQLTAAARAAKDTNEILQTSMHKLQKTAQDLTVMGEVSDDLKKAGLQAGAQARAFEELDAAINRYKTDASSMAAAPLAEKMRAQNGVMVEAKNRVMLLREEFARLFAQIKSGDSTQNTAIRFKEVAVALNLAEKEAREATIAMKELARVDRQGLFGNSINSSRTALSAFQRVRGEILSLATAYVGLYGTISNVQGVIRSYVKLEAAQNRLGVIFGSDGSAIRAEMNFLQAQAARLGLEFGVLADAYTKFAVSANKANFSSQATREIFLSVAEAGRVNKLSMEDMNGVFLALTQMIQKGRVNSEELRQQLAERLPGAVNIFADALGVTTKELNKMLEAGDVAANQDVLLRFARQLDKEFGQQLPAALKTTTTQIGRFWNNVFQAQSQVAKGGFIESFNRLLEEMNKWFQSREGRDFFLSMGAAAGKVADLLTYVVKNLDTFTTAIKAVVAIKIASWLTSIVGNMVKFAAAMKVGGAETTALTTKQKAAVASTKALASATKVALLNSRNFAATLLTTQGRMAALRSTTALGSTAISLFGTRAITARASTIALSVGATILTGTVRTLGAVISALGGPIGILITLGTFLASNILTGWAGDVDDATTAMDEHDRVLQAVLVNYDKLRNKTDGWGDAIEAVTMDQANANLRAMGDEFDKLRKDAATIVTLSDRIGDTDTRDAIAQLKILALQFMNGSKTAKQYREAVVDLYKATNSDRARAGLETALEQARRMEEVSEKFSLAAQVAQGFGIVSDLVTRGLAASGITLGDVADAQDKLTDTTGDLSNAFSGGADNIEAYGDALDDMKKKIPGLGAELKKLGDLADVEASFAKAIAAIDGRFRSAGELYAAAVKAREDAINGINSEFVDSVVGGSFIEKLIQHESGGDPNAKNPGVGQTATGLGQFIESTWLAMFRRYFPDRAANMSKEAILALRTDAATSRAMIELYAKENADALQRAGVAVNDANLYLAHFLGPGGAIDLLTAAPGTAISDILGAGQIAANKGILEGKTREQVIAWAQQFMGITDSRLQAEEAISAQQLKQAEESRKAKEANDKALEDLGFENDMLQQRLAGKEKEAFIEEELRRLRQANPTISEAELANARALLANKYDLNKQLEAQKANGTAIEQQEKRINELDSQRNSLLEQRRIFEDQGNTDKVKEADASLAGINSQLQEAIKSAIEMWQAIGGSEADAAIAKLQTQALAIGASTEAMTGMKYSAKEMQDAIASSVTSGIVNSFDALAQSIANGEKAIDAVATAFRQFAADFLLMIAKMILEQITFNLVQKFAKSLVGGPLAGVMGFHTGGVVGAAGNPSRQVSPGWFQNATRYHTGGIAGLKPGEMPAVLKVGEEVLTDADPRHVKNGGAAGGKSSTRVMNFFDAPSFLAAALDAVIGEEAILNYVRANPGAFKQALNS